MGIIDSNKFKIVCKECGISEDIAVHEKGSAYGATWQSPPRAKKFVVVWSDKSSDGPVIEVATCMECREAAVVAQLP